MERHDIRNRVTVIAGASSAIGRATALAVAARRGRVVLAARRPWALHELAYLCAERGGEAMAVPTDVTREDAVERLMARTAERFGHIDALVSATTVSSSGNMDEIPMALYRRILETNVLGHLHCVRALLPYLRARRGGVVINVAPGVACGRQRGSAARAMSQQAIDGLNEALRGELGAVPCMELCTVYPPPRADDACNRGTEYLYDECRYDQYPYDLASEEAAAETAQAIVDCIVEPRREVYVSALGPVAEILQRLGYRARARTSAADPHEERRAGEPVRGAAQPGSTDNENDNVSRGLLGQEGGRRRR